MPILYLITISNKSSVLKTSPHYKEFHQFVLHLAKIPFKIEQFENTITDEKLSISDLKTFAAFDKAESALSLLI